MEDELVKQQVLMWKEQASRARAIAESAFDYLKETGFDSSASAVSGLKWAQEEERKTRGAEAFITSVKDASTDQLLQTIRQLAERHASVVEDSSEVIEAVETETEDKNEE